MPSEPRARGGLTDGTGAAGCPHSLVRAAGVVAVSLACDFSISNGRPTMANINLCMGAFGGSLAAWASSSSSSSTSSNSAPRANASAASASNAGRRAANAAGSTTTAVRDVVEARSVQPPRAPPARPQAPAAPPRSRRLLGPDSDAEADGAPPSRLVPAERTRTAQLPGPFAGAAGSTARRPEAEPGAPRAGGDAAAARRSLQQSSPARRPPPAAKRPPPPRPRRPPPPAKRPPPARARAPAAPPPPPVTSTARTLGGAVLDAVVHEMVHALGFLSTLYGQFLAEDGTALGLDAVLVNQTDPANPAKQVRRRRRRRDA